MKRRGGNGWLLSDASCPPQSVLDANKRRIEWRMPHSLLSPVPILLFDRPRSYHPECSPMSQFRMFLLAIDLVFVLTMIVKSVAFIQVGEIQAFSSEKIHRYTLVLRIWPTGVLASRSPDRNLSRRSLSRA